MTQIALCLSNNLQTNFERDVSNHIDILIGPTEFCGYGFEKPKNTPGLNHRPVGH